MNENPASTHPTQTSTVLSLSQRSSQGILLLLLLISLLRGFRLPNAYSKAHWLFSYEFGPIKRGLLGTIVRPLLQQVNAYRGEVLIIGLSWLLLALFALAIFLLARRTLSQSSGDQGMISVILWAFAASPFVVYSAHTVGYFDNLLGLLTILALWLLLTKRNHALLIGCIGALAILLHENFLLYGLPALTFVSLCELNIDTRKGLLQQVLSPRLAWVVGLPVATFLLVSSPFFQPSEPTLAQIRERVLGYGIVHASENPALFHALEQGWRDNLLLMQELWQRTSRVDVLADLLTLLPTVLLLTAAASVTLSAIGLARGWLVLYIATWAAPLAMHWVAWDFTRINTFAIFNAFLALIGLLWIANRRVVEAEGRGVRGEELSSHPSTPQTQPWISVAGLCVLILNLSATLPLFDGFAVRQYPFLEIPEYLSIKQKQLARDSFCADLLFANSDFEAGDLRNWTIYESSNGSAFANQPTFGDNVNARQRGSSGHGGQFWVGSFEDNPQPPQITGRVQGDAATGEIVSTAFTIQGRQIGFLIGGGRDAELLYVSIEVAGKEIARLTGHEDETMRFETVNVNALLGQQARIRIVDGSAGGWGHVNVDSFCYTQ